jgi:hypothetical protein
MTGNQMESVFDLGFGPIDKFPNKAGLPFRGNFVDRWWPHLARR